MSVSGNHDLSAYNGGPDAITKHLGPEVLAELAAARDAELHPDLQPWVEEGEWGEMLRHPLVYGVLLMLPGFANRTYEQKKAALAEAIEEKDWHRVVFLHERPYRLRALTDYVTGREDDEEGTPVRLGSYESRDILDLVAQVWVDSENIEQVNEDWRALIGEAWNIWLGDEDERAEFDALPDPIPAWRGGVVGDWSWTTDRSVAEFFTRRSKYEPRFALIPKADCFGYLTRRGEAELLVRLTDERYPLVYPNHTIGDEHDG